MNDLRTIYIARRVAELMGTAHKAERKKVKCLSCGETFSPLNPGNRTCDKCARSNAELGWRCGTIREGKGSVSGFHRTLASV